MEHYVGLDVGLEETSICVVDRDGNSVRETKVTTEPEAIRCPSGEKATDLTLLVCPCNGPPIALPLSTSHTRMV